MKPIGPIISELWFEMFWYSIKKIEFFFVKRPTDYNPNYFSIIPVQDWSKTSPVENVCPLRTLKYSKSIDVDILLDKNQKQLLHF